MLKRINPKLLMRNKTFTILFGILTLFSSCKGQGDTPKTQNALTQKSLTSSLTELDPKATVIYVDNKDNIWFASSEKGVYRYDGKAFVLFTSVEGLGSYRILSIQEDNFGNFYFDTPEGIYKYDGKKFTILTVAKNKAPEHEWKSEPEDLWFRMGWDKSGPYRFDGKNLYHLKLPKNNMENDFYKKHPNASYNPYGIYSIYKDSKDNIWLGTSNLGIYLFDGKEISWMFENQWTETPDGGSFGIRSIAEDQDGNYWICNSKYKYKLLSNDLAVSGLKPIHFKRQIGIENKEKQVLYFLAMENDSNGDVLMSTYENGIWRNNGQELIQVVIKDEEKEIIPSSVYKDKEDKLWFGTPSDGIYSYNGISFKKFRPSKTKR